MTKYTRITLGERENIYRLLQLKLNQTSIAKELKRHKSSISRELSRCKSNSLGYLPDRASLHAQCLLVRNHGLLHNADLQSHVIDKLRLGWSPEQIAGRMKLGGNDLTVSHETIYKFIYSQSGQTQKLYLLLTRHKPKRTKWYSRKPRQSHISESANIKHRPKVIEKRKSIGHFEGDLVVFGSLRSSNVTTIVERKSRFVELVYNENKYTTTVIGGIKKRLTNLPKKRVKTITFDRGTEFASFRELGITTYFCNPHSPWQKGSNENYNGRLRRYLPKKFNHRNLSQELLDTIAENMNNQPRKCLGFKTPAEVFLGKSARRVALDP